MASWRGDEEGGTQESARKVQRGLGQTRWRNVLPRCHAEQAEKRTHELRPKTGQQGDRRDDQARKKWRSQSAPICSSPPPSTPSATPGLPLSHVPPPSLPVPNSGLTPQLVTSATHPSSSISLLPSFTNSITRSSPHPPSTIACRVARWTTPTLMGNGHEAGLETSPAGRSKRVLSWLGDRRNGWVSKAERGRGAIGYARRAGSREAGGMRGRT